MKDSNPTPKDSSIQYGLILGGILATSTTLIYALNQELFLSIWIGVFTILVVIGTGIFATAKAKDILGGFMSFKEAFTAYFIATAVGLAISTLVGILIFSVVDTELASYLNDQSIEMTREFMERFNTPQEVIDESLRELGEIDNFSMVNQAKSYASGLIVQAVIGLLVGLIFKKSDPNAID
jgi:hypothetical protein